jgi:hypothetical protein
VKWKKRGKREGKWRRLKEERKVKEKQRKEE